MMPRRGYVGIQLHESHLDCGLTIFAPKSISPSKFWKFRTTNPNLRVELDARGQIVAAPPNWLKYGPTSPFQRPSGAVLTPGDSWISKARAAHIIDANEIQGEGPLATFKLNLRPIWKGRA